MFRKYRFAVSVAVSLLSLISVRTSARAQTQQPSSGTLPVSISVYDRTRVNAWQWFAAPPETETYGYAESLVRLGVARRIHHWDWQLELSQPAVLGLPDDAVSPVTAQGQLGLGATYYASNASDTDPAAAFLKQGFLRYHFHGGDKNLRIGRFEFIDGQETHPKDATLAWLQTNRIAHRLIGNFGFSNAQRSFDGADGHYGAGRWDITAIAARADQGVFNMNGNPELNVDLQYLAFTQTTAHQHLLWRAFAVGYHDGRTGLTKTDNRALAVRAADHGNIRIGTWGGNLLASAPAGPGRFDFLFWGALQNGSWGALSHSANAAAVEGGYQLSSVASAPWLRGGWFRSSGDNNAADNEHHTFFQILPTPRIYARIPFYNLMNSTDEFVQIIDSPSKRLALRSDLHWLQLTSGNDLWYQGGGAYDNKVFGYTGRPGNGHTSFASVADVSADWQAAKDVAVNFYYAHVSGKSVIGKIYPSDRDAQYGYVELVYQWGRAQKVSAN
ncbi:alginate export family protein [Paracidobacterium acidisoli]|uniref:Alginate export domain-containing protein n=1 Tax=Paracidobacterium acidisoli TaxID=2303751 RepID=A0A372IUJ5_9BACT|nr:alginate export family protein [Paracidobacterium acidisoli]MBT9330091.1 alginate export family protein [Paracidobacterium acidisoli]